MMNSADPDQLASSEANTEHVVFSKRRVKGQSRILSVYTKCSDSVKSTVPDPKK